MDVQTFTGGDRRGAWPEGSDDEDAIAALALGRHVRREVTRDVIRGLGGPAVPGPRLSPEASPRQPAQVSVDLEPVDGDHGTVQAES